jgi:hypothetical protein
VEETGKSASRISVAALVTPARVVVMVTSWLAESTFTVRTVSLPSTSVDAGLGPQGLEKAR